MLVTIDAYQTALVQECDIGQKGVVLGALDGMSIVEIEMTSGCQNCSPN